MSSPFRILLPSRVQTEVEENLLPASLTTHPKRYFVEMSLFFVVLADPFPNPSQISIAEVNNINETTIVKKEDLNTLHLKEMIWNTEKNFFALYNHNSFKDLTLWKVSKELREETDEWELLKALAKNYTEDNIKSFGCRKLLSTGNVSKDFQGVPIDCIHILVQPPPPATTGKRRHIDSDSDESGTRKKEKQTPKTLASLLTSTILQPPVKQTPSHNFYDRDQALNSVLEVARSNYEGRKSPDHKDHTFILIPGGIGIGKTRMGWESQCLSSMLGYDTPDFIEALKDPCYIFIDLNNKSKYIGSFDDKVHKSVRIGARVAIASGLVSGNLSDLLNINLFQLPDVICEILKRRSKSVEAIIIHLDEYQLYIDDFQKHKQQSWIDSRDFFKEMLREIGSVMRGYKMASEYRGKYFIIPIVTGTSAIDFHFLPTEHTRIMLNLKPLNYESAKSMFLDMYEYSRQTTDEGRNFVTQSLKSHYSSDLNNEGIGTLSTKFCKLVLNQQHFRIAMFDTGFIPKFIDDLLGSHILASDFDWGNKLSAKISNRNIVKIGENPGEWKSLKDMRTIISFGLTRQLIKRDFLLPSRSSIGELERSGLVYLSNIYDEWYTIVMPFMLLKVLNKKLLISNVEPVFQDNILLIPTHDSSWQWQNFELLYGHYQKALIDSLINVKESKLLSINHKIQLLQSNLQKEVDDNTKLQIEDRIRIQNINFTNEMNNNWQLSDIFRGAKGADTLLQHRVRLHKIKVYTEKEKFLVKTSDIAKFTKFVSCDDNVTREFDKGIFRCYKGCANIDHRWVLDSADGGKKLAIFSQIKYSERDATTTISTPTIKRWYKTTMASVKNYENEYDVILVLFTNRTYTGTIDIGEMPQLLLIHSENIEDYLSPTFAHRGLVSGSSENDY